MSGRLQGVLCKTFLRQDATQVVESWDKEDTYVSGRNQINRAARTYPYYASPNNQAKEFQLAINAAIPLDGQTVNIVFLDPKTDGGLPHTRGKHGIALPDFMLWQALPEKTLQHEMVHLSQKQYPERWWKWYYVYWNMKPLEDLEAVPRRWRDRSRQNPDLLDHPLAVWKGRYVPMTVFMNEISPNLRECKRGFWDLEAKMWLWDAPSGWTQLVGVGFNDEHPHEIAAHWLDGSAGPEKQKFFNLNPI
jgi:hypothetical protein